MQFGEIVEDQDLNINEVNTQTDLKRNFQVSTRNKYKSRLMILILITSLVLIIKILHKFLPGLYLGFREKNVSNFQYQYLNSSNIDSELTRSQRIKQKVQKDHSQKSEIYHYESADTQDIKINKTQYKEYFKHLNSKLTIILPKQGLKTKYQPIAWPQFRPLPTLPITVIFITSYRRSRKLMFGKVLKSFFTFNTYPIYQIYAINDGGVDEDLQDLIQMYPNITWLFSNIKVGQLLAIDLAYQFINTTYYLHCEDDFQFIKSGFVQYMIQSLQYDQRLSGLYIGGKGQKSKLLHVGPLYILTELHFKYYSGFTLSSSMHRLKDYQFFQGGYSMATHNISYGLGAGKGEKIISAQMSIRGFHIAQTATRFAYHLGNMRGLPKPPATQQYKRLWSQLLNRYNEWFKDHDSQQKQLKWLSYLSQR